jgi:hypothetical protein
VLGPKLLRCQEILDVIVVNDLFLEGISTCLGRFHHLDHLGKVFSFTALECRNYFLCHGRIFLCAAGALQLLDLLVSGYLLEDRVVLLQLYPVRTVLLVLGGDIPGCSMHTAVLVLGALEDHLDSVTFLSHFIPLLLNKGCKCMYYFVFKQKSKIKNSLIFNLFAVPWES